MTLWPFLLVIGWVVFVVGGKAAHTERDGVAGFWLAVAAALLISSALLIVTNEYSYRQGQIDAMSKPPVLRYELRDRPDGSRMWVEIEDNA